MSIPITAKKRINLLPPAEQKEVARLRINAEVLRFGVVLTLSLLVLATILFSVNLWLGGMLNENNTDIARYTDELARYKGTALQKEVASLNENMKNFNKLNSQSMKWSSYLIEFASLIPEDLSIDSLIMNRSTGKVEATGKASNRSSVLTLRQRILDSKYFKNINFPLYNLETARDVGWKYRFYMRLSDEEE